MQAHTSTLPLHGGLVDIANQIVDRHRHVSFISERSRTYDPVANGLAVCPNCHVLRNRQSELDAVPDDDPANSRRYKCSECHEQFRVGT